MPDIKTKWPGWNVFCRKNSVNLDRRTQLKMLYKDAEGLVAVILSEKYKDFYFGRFQVPSATC